MTVGVALLLLPQATLKNTPLSARPSSTVIRIRFLRVLKPAPRNASPEIGRKAAYQTREPRHNDVGTGRAVVVMVRVELAGLLFEIVTGVVENVHAAPAGKPAEHVSATLFGKLGTGETCT